jgi:hypothetical protein
MYPSIIDLIKEVSGALKEAGGASCEYQHVMVELEALQRALDHVSGLSPSATNINHVNAIRGVALSCRLPLQQFLQRIGKYEPSLGSFAPKRRLHGASDKAKWALHMSDEVNKFRASITAKVMSINVLLATNTS